MLLRAVLLILCCFCAASGGVYAQEGDAAPERLRGALKYKVNLDGETKSLNAKLKAGLELYTEKDTKLYSLAGLRERMEQSRESAIEVLRSEGYYSGTALTRVRVKATDEQNYTVEFRVAPGKRYRFSKGALSFTDSPDPSLREELAAIEAALLPPSAPARAELGLTLGPALVARLKELGYPFARVAERVFIVDHAQSSVTPKISISRGPKANIARLDMSGLQTVEREYVERLADIDPGELYDQRQVDAFRDRLIQSGLFSGISLRPVEPENATAGETQDIALAVELEEAKMRRITAQLGLATDVGISLETEWSHRNIFGRGETLTLSALAAQREQSLDAVLSFPNFKRLDQVLSVGLGFSREDFDAFNALSATSFAVLERQVSERWVVSGGGRLEAQRIEDAQGRRTFYLGALPLSARYDGTENFFDPQDGLRADFAVTPEAGFGDETLLFVTNEVTLRGYKSVDVFHGTVLAARATFKTVYGASTTELPANRRFYAGGGGSIRGFGFQQVGPEDAEGEPLGGRSLLELSAEARIKVTETIGVVPFVDMGNVYQDVLPQFSGFRYGVGLGVRYYTDFAPIRFDIGTPLNRQPGEDRVHIYISIGQSF